ncbi:uncharacterized protein [Dysidea avara]|uniref:uncharacterized protein isoform X2 n=1 Tax=Dysidea avara TaxID=196820 RepID=UPI00332FA507
MYHKAGHQDVVFRRLESNSSKSMSKPSVSQQDIQADILSWKESSLKSAQQAPTVHSRASRPSARSLTSVQKNSTASTHRTTVSKEPSIKSIQEVPKIVTTTSSRTSRPVPSAITRLQNESIASTPHSTQGTIDVETKTSMVQTASHCLDSRNDGNSQHTGSTSRSLIAPLSPLIHDDLWHSVSTEFPVLAEYLKEMQLDQKLPEVLSNIFKLKLLPFSPYSQLMCDVRPIMERYQQASVTFSQLSNLNTSDIIRPWPGSMLNKCENHIWGVPPLLQWIHPSFVLRYDWLIGSIQESFNPVYELNYEIKSIVCLSGPTIFGGGLLSQPPSINIRVEVVITGESEQKAVELFAKQVVRDIKSTANRSDYNHHLIIGVSVKDSKWSVEDIHKNEEQFREIIEQTTIDNVPITAHCVFAMDESSLTYQFGEKTYTLNFVKPSTTANSQVKVFADNQYSALYSSLVFGESFGKRYAALFAPGQRQARKLLSVPTRLSINQSSSARQETLPAVIDQEEVNKFGHDDQLLVQIYNITHCPTYWLQLAMCQCEHLLKVIQSKIDKDGDIVKVMFDQLKKMFANVFNPLHWEQTSDMKTHYSDLTDQINQIDPTALTANNHKVLSHLYYYLQGIIIGTLQHVLAACPAIKRMLKSIHRSFPKVTVKDTTGGRKQHSKAKNKEPNKKSKTTFKLFRSQPQPQEEDDDIELDDADYKNNSVDDYTGCFLDVNQLEKDSKFPSEIAKEAVLLQYVVDTRMDECIRIFLIDLLVNVVLPRNPYSTLMSLLRQHHWRLCLWQQTSSEISQQLTHNKEQLDVPSSFLFQLSTEELFGCAPVLSVVSSDHLSPLVAAVLKDYTHHKHIHTKARLKVKTSTCVTGPAVLYGAVLPYLFDVVVHEHYMITGNWMNKDEQPNEEQQQLAISFMSEIVITNILQMVQSSGMICTRLELGSLTWSPGDITSKEEQLKNKLHVVLNKKEDIVLKFLYLYNNCYIPTSKHYYMHLYHEDGVSSHNYMVFYSTKMMSLYTSVFASRDKALDLYELQFVDEPDPLANYNLTKLTTELDKQIIEKWNQREYVPAYRYLLIRSLITKQWSQFGEGWHMLHSIVAELEYVQHLCHVLNQLAMLPPTHSPDPSCITSMIKTVYVKLQVVLTKASDMSMTSMPLLEYIKELLHPYLSPKTDIIGKESSVVFLRVATLVIPVMNVVFQDIHTLCEENNQMLDSLKVKANSY